MITTSMILPRATLLVATVLAGLAAGFFFTYEASVTIGLARVGDRAYVETFQAINDTIRNPAFGIVFFGTVPALAVALALNWSRASTLGQSMLVAAIALYLAGIAVTVAGNIPLNEELAQVGTETTAVTASEAAQARADFEDDWNRLNLIRALAFMAAFTAASIALAIAPAQTPDSASGSGREAEGAGAAAIGHNR